MRVHVPSQLRGYTRGEVWVQSEGATMDEVLHALDARYPGFRFRVIDEQERVRPHIALFVGGERQEDLRTPIPPGDELYILGALSGG